MDARRALVAVIGSTGTGKSQLAVELAEYATQELGMPAEAISADSMQTYIGLDVITNKAAKNEMRSIPHHLMSFLAPGQEYDVTQFVNDANALCDRMHAAHTLPIIVGGTTYYVQHLFFPGRLVSQVEPMDASLYARQTAARVESLPSSLRSLWDLLGSDEVRVNAAPPAEPTELWALLDAMDPESAQRWHYRDQRKV